jgi:adenylate cyclase
MAPDEVVSMLREFHEHMASGIFACGGTIDKYIGDAILAVFGLPTAGSEDAAHALCCAGRMLQALEQWSARRSARGEPALAIGIGINYGPAVLGDVGSDQGLSFTVIGDTVNTAHRLQVLTRSLKTPLVVADALVATLRDGRTDEVKALLGQLRDQGDHVLRGRSTPVRIWTKPSEFA